jgi:hypothetical protein
MTNEERRTALNLARSKALEFAQRADTHWVNTAEDGPEAMLAMVWANVAQAMKDGSPTHDAP